MLRLVVAHETVVDRIEGGSPEGNRMG